MTIQRIAVWLVVLLVPVALVLSAVRVALHPWFLQFEYNRPGFPADRYGFTTEDRLYWSQFALDYLLNNEDISYLGDLRFENGAPVYNQRELSHMVDVKVVVQAALTVWYVSLGVLVLIGLWAWRGRWLEEYRRGLRLGGWVTAGLIGFIILFVLISFSVFFVAFHNVFFQPGTWMFQFSDTLIRLFPERFWQDVFILVGGLSFAGSLALALGLRSESRPGPA